MSTDKDASLTRALVRLIRGSDLTQSQWAREVGVSPAAVTYWLKGEHHPTEGNVRELIRTAQRLEVPPDLLAPLIEQLPPSPTGFPAAPDPADDPEWARAVGRLHEVLAEIAPERRADMTLGLVDQLEHFVHHPEPMASMRDFARAWGRLEPGARNDTLRTALLSELRELSARARRVAAGGDLEKWIRRDSAYVLSFFKQITLQLPTGYHYHTVSNLDFWSGHTLSSRRDFLATQERAAHQRNLEIKRLFLVPEEEPVDTDPLKRLGEHARVESIESRVLSVPRGEVKGIGNFVLCGPTGGDDETLFQLRFRIPPGSDQRELDLVNVTSDPTALRGKRASFDAHFSEGVELEDFLAGTAATK